MKTIMLLATIIVIFSCSEIKPISGNTYEALSDYRIGNFSTFTDSPDKRYFYSIYFKNDTVFYYISYDQVIDQGTKVNIDSFRISGTYRVNEKELLLNTKKGFLEKKHGIKWKIRKDHILIKGYNTKRIALYLKE